MIFPKTFTKITPIIIKKIPIKEKILGIWLYLTTPIIVMNMIVNALYVAYAYPIGMVVIALDRRYKHNIIEEIDNKVNGMFKKPFVAFNNPFATTPNKIAKNR